MFSRKVLPSVLLLLFLTEWILLLTRLLSIWFFFWLTWDLRSVSSYATLVLASYHNPIASFLSWEGKLYVLLVAI